MIANMTELTDIFGPAYNSFNAWTKEGLPAADRPGKGKAASFDTKEVFRWLVDREVQKALSKTEGNGQIDELRAAKLAEEVEAKRRENLRAKGELVLSDEIGKAMAGIVLAGREYLRRVTPTRIARRCQGGTESEIAAAALDEIELALHEWSAATIIDVIEDEGGALSPDFGDGPCPLCRAAEIAKGGEA
jgi:phage terminase Nu1 subunit (DNA packaging protein)